jgi:hypothetical protein
VKNKIKLLKHNYFTIKDNVFGTYGGSIFSSNQFFSAASAALKMQLASKVVKID